MTTDDFMAWLQTRRGTFRVGRRGRIENSSYRTPTEELCEEQGLNTYEKPYNDIGMYQWTWWCLESAGKYTPDELLNRFYLSAFERPTYRDLDYGEVYEDYEFRLRLRAAMLDALGLEEPE